MNTRQKILVLTELENIVAGLRKLGKKIVTTNGVFDMLHISHKRALEGSKSLGDILIVGVNSDASVKQYKSDLRPIIPEIERVEMVAALACVDYVTIFDEPDPVSFLELVKPDIHTKGGNYDPEKLLETDIVRRNNGKVVIMPGGIQSTTNIIESITKVYCSKYSEKK